MFLRAGRIARSWRNGFVLTEFVIAMGIGLFLIAGLLTVMTHWLGVDGHLLTRSRLNRELGDVLALMRREVGRAGYWGRSGDGPEEVNGYQGITAPGNRCLLYRYDHRGDDRDGVPSADDMSGFRLNNGVVQYRTRTRGCVHDACDRCNLGIWWALTDANFVTVESLDFVVSEKRRPGSAVLKEVRIGIKGRSVHGDATVVDLSATVLAGGD